jgi:ribosome recycling factor
LPHPIQRLHVLLFNGLYLNEMYPRPPQRLHNRQAIVEVVLVTLDQRCHKIIEKAILESDLGLNPNTSGTVLRIPLPPLSEERRRDLVKVTKSEAENSRVAIRNIRRDAIHHLKELEKNKEISEDDERKAEDQVQKATDLRIKKIDEVLAEKEREMLEI